MALEDKHPKWYFFLHFWGSFLGPIFIFGLGLVFAIQSKSQEETNAYLAETINTLIVANSVGVKTEPASKVISPKYSMKIWYPKGDPDLRKKAFSYKNELLRQGYKNNVQVYSVGGVLWGRYTPPKVTKITFNKQFGVNGGVKVMDALSKLLGVSMQIGKEVVEDFDVLLIVGENA